MTEYTKRLHRREPDQEEFYHWRVDCPDSPIRGKEINLIFKEKPLYFKPCEKCTQLDRNKKTQSVKAS